MKKTTKSRRPSATLAYTKSTKYPYVLAELYPKKSNNTSRYCVRFKAWDETQNELIEKVIWLPSKLKTMREKRLFAQEIISKINQALVEGKCFKDEDIKIETPTLKPNTCIKNVISEMLRIKQLEIRAKSKNSYGSIFKKFVEYLEYNHLEKVDITKFEPKYAIRFRDFLLEEKGNISTTINKSIITIQSFFKMAIIRGYIEKNPFENIKPLMEIESTRNVAFTKEHQNILEEWMKINDPLLLHFTRFIYCAFIRPRELRQLMGKDVDLVKKQITIKGDIAKNHKTQFIPINRVLLEAIGTKTDYLSSDRRLFGKNMIWLSKGQCSENYAYYRHVKALRATGLTNYNYTLYSWKHTGACRAIEAGVNPRKLQGLLRHSSLEETDTYLRSLGISLQNEELKEVW